MDPQLRDLVDREAIARLIFRYADRVDGRDPTGVVECFTPDAHFEAGGGAFVVDGAEALARFFEQALAAGPDGIGGMSTHLMTNVMVDLDGNAAHAETKAVAYLTKEDARTVVVRGLRYSDDCVRAEHGWRLQRRVHQADWQYEVPASEITTPAR
jgi:ketosteroid isomerase-like protein